MPPHKYSLETSNGIKQEEFGQIVNEGSENVSIAVHGSYQWTDKDGEVYAVTYVADDKGFQPEGAHLPKTGINLSNDTISDFKVDILK